MITTVTLNTSIDKAYVMEEEIKNGTVMRVASCHNTAGGKGLNVARTIRLCNTDVLAVGFAGGHNGRYLEQLLDEDKIPHDFVHVPGETRSCINILDPKYHSTEYLEPGFELTEKEETEFLRRFPEMIAESDVVTISGSLPKGIKKDMYYRMILLAKSMGKQVLLDTSGESFLQGIKAIPTMIKPNRDELEAIFNVKLSTIQDVIFYGKKLSETGIPYVIISLGKEGALMICENGIYQGRPPQIEAVNPVGCGDAMTGAFAVAFAQGKPPADALRFAVSVATAKAMSPSTGSFSPKHYEHIFQQVTIEKNTIEACYNNISK